MDIENNRGYNCNGSSKTREEEIQKEDESEVVRIGKNCLRRGLSGVLVKGKK